MWNITHTKNGQTCTGAAKVRSTRWTTREKPSEFLVKEPGHHLEESGVNGRKILQRFRMNKICSMYCTEVDQTQTSRRHFCLHGNELLGIIGARTWLDEPLSIFYASYAQYVNLHTCRKQWDLYFTRETNYIRETGREKFDEISPISLVDFSVTHFQQNPFSLKQST